jgi:hypothetical protein
MDASDTTDTVRACRLRRGAVIAGITLVVLKVFAVGIYVRVLVILFPPWGDHANATFPALIMVQELIPTGRGR